MRDDAGTFARIDLHHHDRARNRRRFGNERSRLGVRKPAPQRQQPGAGPIESDVRQPQQAGDHKNSG